MISMDAVLTTPLDADAVRAECKGELGAEIVRLAETGSTNEEARRLAEAGAPHGLVVVADFQRQGRGRRGAAWVSPPMRNLLCSVLLRPAWPMQHWSRLTHAAAVSIHLALEAAGVSPAIKWPNDVYARHRKISGILLEAGTGRGGPFVVVGFGVNVNLAEGEFPPELQHQATSVWRETGKIHRREPILAAILSALDHWSRQAENAFPLLLDFIRSHSLLLHRQVRLEVHGEVRKGTVVDFSAQGGLLLQTPDGRQEEFLSADCVRLI